MKNAKNTLTDWDQWKILLAAADELAALVDRETVQFADIITALERAETAFPKGVDPVDQPKEYACRQFCKFLKRALEHAEENGNGLALH